VFGATIGGGGSSGSPNRVPDHYGTVGGGLGNHAGGWNGDPSDDGFATVGGGNDNQASGYASTVGGGISNTASGGAATVGGGSSNTASHIFATVAGGTGNAASDDHTTIGGGWNNIASGWQATVGGGYGNTASGGAATVAGGHSNTASAYGATVGGGWSNAAQGYYSFAAGHQAKASHDGAFVWGDSTDADIASTGNDQFVVRANGGVKVVRGASAVSNTGAALQVEQAAADGDGAWFRLVSASNTYPVLKLVKPNTTNSNFAEGFYDGGGRKFHIDNNGTYVAGSDFAESMPVVGEKAEYEPGDVLVIHSASAPGRAALVSTSRPGEVTRCTYPYDTAVIGVYSTRPGVLGADKGGVTEVRPNDIPVAIVGIVRVKVSAENGAIRPGDLLTTSATPGHAMRASPITVNGVTFYPAGVLVGKALEALDLSQGTGVILMLVTLQ
jgi:hypothetical protein